VNTLFPISVEVPSRLKITPRAYQAEDLANSLELYDKGVRGMLCRLATGLGKTICACMAIDKWLANGPDYYTMVISYEKQLVWQFAQEIEDVLRITPGIEMEKETVDQTRLPKVIVASRQTLLRKALATDEQKEELAAAGFEAGLITKSLAKRCLTQFRNGTDHQLIREAIEEHNAHWQTNHDAGAVSRLYKFDHRLNWLIVWDEAHKHAHKLTSVGHIHDWFHRNPNSWDKGLTATPKRFDGVNIGDKMFPGIAVDYPLTKAVEDGYAVPYVQKYIVCDKVDFRQLKQIAGDFDDGDLERVLFAEGELAKLCEPMFDLVGDKRTLIFSPTVQTAKDVCNYINARRELTCECGKVKWIATMLIGDGATCECGHVYSETDITKHDHQAGVVYGEIPPQQRKEIYRQHQSGSIQFLSVCGLCREGYNDQQIGAVAVFRPVSKKASSLAEQMKGRGSRVLPGLIEGIDTPDERLRLIAESDKPSCLIIDLVGITGLADCASTVQIYAKGRDDEVIERAEELQVGGVEDVQEAIEQAQRQIDDEREERARLKREEEERHREEAERRAKAQAEVTYSTHDIGHGSDPLAMTERQRKGLRWRGIELTGVPPSKRQASRMIGQLEAGVPVETVIYENGIHARQWEPSRPTVKQCRLLRHFGISGQQLTPRDASHAIDAIKAAEKAKTFADGVLEKIKSAKTADELTGAGRAAVAGRNKRLIGDNEFQSVVAAGRKARAQLIAPADEF